MFNLLSISNIDFESIINAAGEVITSFNPVDAIEIVILAVLSFFAFR